jgi:hypothetical protein
MFNDLWYDHPRPYGMTVPYVDGFISSKHFTLWSQNLDWSYRAVTKHINLTSGRELEGELQSRQNISLCVVRIQIGVTEPSWNTETSPRHCGRLDLGGLGIIFISITIAIPFHIVVIPNPSGVCTCTCSIPCTHFIQLRCWLPPCVSSFICFWGDGGLHLYYVCSGFLQWHCAKSATQ